jgi:predicted metal-dependent HD superfamily phosphohydrolase
MFETTFKSQLAVMSSDGVLLEKMREEVHTQYSKQNRYYHTLEHLDHLVRELSSIRTQIDDWLTLVFSVAYHDIIYNTRRSDNEEKSADFAAERLSLIKMPKDKIDKCRQQILATKVHSISSDNDTNLFTDADLAILGAEPDRYKTYTEQIRKEYSLYPDFLYKPGRKKVLTHFLQMPVIYKTSSFAEKYERQARENIHREFEELG